MNTQTSKYVAPSIPFIKVPNGLIEDRSLSSFARVLFCTVAYMLSIRGFVPTVGALRIFTGKSSSTIAEGLAELRTRGSLRQYRSCSSGKWAWSFLLFAEPQNDGLSAIQQKRQIPSSRYFAPQSRYTKVKRDLILRHDIKPATKVIYLFLAAHAGKPGFILHPWSIANELDYNEQTIQKHIQKLRKLGYIDAAQTRNANGRMGAMDYIVYAAPTAHRSTGDAFAGDVSTVDASGRGSNNNLTNNNLSKEDTESNQPLQELTNCPLEIADACDWIPNRFFDVETQHIYDAVVDRIGTLYIGNTDVREVIRPHLDEDDLFLCELADRITESCVDRILYPNKGAAAVVNRNGYITEVCKDCLLHWEDKQQEFESI